MKPIELSTQLKKETQPLPETILNYISLFVMIIILIVVVHFIGIEALKIFNYQPMNILYNFIFGFGIITFVAFIISGIQELTENKGVKRVRK